MQGKKNFIETVCERSRKKTTLRRVEWTAVTECKRLISCSYVSSEVAGEGNVFCNESMRSMSTCGVGQCFMRDGFLRN